MKWDNGLLGDFKWCGEIINYDQKILLARDVALIAKDGDVIGFGSGSTSFLIAGEIAKRVKAEDIHISAIPTSPELKLACFDFGIPVESLNNVRPDWSFDGADEVDADHNLIKGRGGAMFIEKLLIRCSPKNYIVVDNSKIVDTLGTKFAIPVEFTVDALVYVRKELLGLGATEITLRLAKAKDGPVVTENANYIYDVRFEEIYPELENHIKLITGVIESGLFWGYNVEIVKP
jgi:ribose 5-phosphate isomerase A